MPQLKTTVYSARAANRSVFAHLRGVIQDLPQAHELGYRLFKQNLKALYRQFGLNEGDMPNAEKYYAYCLSLPMYPKLTEEEQQFVINKVNSFYNQKN